MYNLHNKALTRRSTYKWMHREKMFGENLREAGMEVALEH